MNFDEDLYGKDESNLSQMEVEGERTGTLTFDENQDRSVAYELVNLQVPASNGTTLSRVPLVNSTYWSALSEQNQPLLASHLDSLLVQWPGTTEKRPVDGIRTISLRSAVLLDRGVDDADNLFLAADHGGPSSA